MTPAGIDLTDDPREAIDRLTEGIDDALLRAEPASRSVEGGREQEAGYPLRTFRSDDGER
jgi:hypothetical protein